MLQGQQTDHQNHQPLLSFLLCFFMNLQILYLSIRVQEILWRDSKAYLVPSSFSPWCAPLCDHIPSTSRQQVEGQLAKKALLLKRETRFCFQSILQKCCKGTGSLSGFQTLRTEISSHTNLLIPPPTMFSLILLCRHCKDYYSWIHLFRKDFVTLYEQ